MTGAPEGYDRPSAAMPVVPFDPIAQSLEVTLSSLTGKMRNQLAGARGAATVATNSSLVESRAAPLVAMLRERGVESLEGLTVADLGCGFGSLSLYYATQGATVVGLDPKAGPLRVGRAVAAEHDLPAVFARAPMQALELPDERFDVVVQN